MYFNPSVAIIADIEKYYDYLTSAMDYEMLKDVGTDLLLYYIDDIRLRRPEMYDCPQSSSTLTIDDQLNILVCCGMDRYVKDAVLGNLLYMTLEEIRFAKQNVDFCAKCR